MGIGRGLTEPVWMTPTLEEHSDLIKALDETIRKEVVDFCFSVDLRANDADQEDQLEIVCDTHHNFELKGSFIRDGWEFEQTKSKNIDKNKYGSAMSYALYLMEVLMDMTNGLVSIHWAATVFYDSRTKMCGFHLYDEHDNAVTVTILPHVLAGTTTTIH